MTTRPDKQKRPSKEVKAEARIQWESRHDLTFAAVAAAIGVTDTAVRKWAKEGGWVKAGTLGQVNDRAHLKADAESSEDVRAKLGAKLDAPKQASVDQAIDLRAKIITTHRAEWRRHATMFPLEQMHADLDVGRKAKMAAETITLRQRGERAAWGLDDAEANRAAAASNAPQVIRIVAAEMPA